MFERFTSSAKDAVVRAQHEARGLGHPRITSGHVLLAIADRGQSIGARVLADLGFDTPTGRAALGRSVVGAARVLDDEDADALRTLGIDLDDVRSAAESSFGPGALERAHERWHCRGHIPLTPESKKALQLALREAIQLGDRHIGTEHLLLGVLRDRWSSAKSLLVDQRIRVEDVRKAVAAEVAHRRRGNTA